MQTVYVLEGRGHEVYMHWFLFVIAGLRDIPSQALIHTQITEPFQRETLELLAPEYTFVEALDSSHTPVRVHGAPLIDGFFVDDPYYGFVRSLLFSKLPCPETPPTRLVYISRSKAGSLLWRQRAQAKNIRHLANEEELLSHLSTRGVECIHLEDYSLREKIRLFQTAKLIITPCGGALTTCFFAHPSTTIIELRHPSCPWVQYEHICTVLGLRHVQYSALDLITDGTENIVIPNIPVFLQTIDPYLS